MRRVEHHVEHQLHSTRRRVTPRFRAVVPGLAATAVGLVMAFGGTLGAGTTAEAAPDPHEQSRSLCEIFDICN